MPWNRTQSGQILNKRSVHCKKDVCQDTNLESFKKYENNIIQKNSFHSNEKFIKLIFIVLPRAKLQETILHFKK